MVHWSLLLGVPFPCFPDALQYHACFDILVGGILIIWPKYILLMFNIVEFIGSVFAVFRTSSYVINLFDVQKFAQAFGLKTV